MKKLDTQKMIREDFDKNWHGSKSDPEWYESDKDKALKVKITERTIGGHPYGTFVIREFDKTDPIHANLLIRIKGQNQTATINLDNPPSTIKFYLDTRPITARQAFNMFQVKKRSGINEDTSATGGPAVSGSSFAAPTGGGVALANASTAGMGPVQSSQPSAFPGALNGTNWINGGGESGSGDISVPYNPSGANRMFQKISSPMGKNHGSKTGKKSREKKLDLKHLRDVLKNRPKSGSGKIMNFDNFAKKDITTKVTRVKESVDSSNSGISTSEVWTILGYGDTSIDRIFITENEARESAELANSKWRDHKRNIHKNMSDEEFEEYFKFEQPGKKHLTLDDAIDEIKDSLRDDYSMSNAGEDY